MEGVHLIHPVPLQAAKKKHIIILHVRQISTGSLITRRRCEGGRFKKKKKKVKRDLMCKHKYIWGESECRGEAEAGTDAKWIRGGRRESEKDRNRQETNKKDRGRERRGTKCNKMFRWGMTHKYKDGEAGYESEAGRMQQHNKEEAKMI